ncbi:uncharacterized protein BO72DRAFT_242457 [Aspergillus fijiensis CBS 313.89]|uniref:Uncharacterized protein n=1 Tax=Aspergillus fijiensis CBS 313.89 TaxID=1448319 RepID=A0A8G1S0Y0_9EURO|nr:uncharacterized protein BO72DRAFT_242457 [Aspergillus fijiensis CBS 313.89]RAK81311.1 hypothetical protein BO72DRAFT_242457 [Aspergillus fijiensis CBS 313.89]
MACPPPRRGQSYYPSNLSPPSYPPPHLHLHRPATALRGVPRVRRGAARDEWTRDSLFQGMDSPDQREFFGKMLLFYLYHSMILIAWMID